MTIDGLQVPIGHPFSNNRGLSVGAVPIVPEGIRRGLFYHEVLHAIEQQRAPVLWEVGWGITKLLEQEIPVPFDVPLPFPVRGIKTVLDLIRVQKPNDRLFENRAKVVQDFVDQAITAGNFEGFKVVPVPR